MGKFLWLSSSEPQHELTCLALLPENLWTKFLDWRRLQSQGCSEKQEQVAKRPEKIETCFASEFVPMRCIFACWRVSRAIMYLLVLKAE